MSFIDKNDPVVLNIKITTKGREKLSKGKLNFTHFAIGDGEMNYRYLLDGNIPCDEFNILKPFDKNPKILSTITKIADGDGLNEIPPILSIPTTINNLVDSVGFFNNDLTLKNTTEYFKQGDVICNINDVSGGNVITLYKSSTYGSNTNEPIVGDIMLIRWTNGIADIDTDTYLYDDTYVLPVLFYRIVEIISGSLSTNNLVLRVDRELPNINVGGLTTSSGNVGVIIFSGEKPNISPMSYLGDSYLTFLENCQCPTIIFPYWDLSIVFGDNVPGIGELNLKFNKNKTCGYLGFFTYIQNQAPVLGSLGIIHYTNQSPSNVYGEGFLINTQEIIIPHIMWHKSGVFKSGVKLQSTGVEKILMGDNKSLDINYYDLADEYGNVVGKTFPSLKLFLIEDSELLFALSYKSNRSWTLPNYNVGVNSTIYVDCPECLIDYDVSYVFLAPPQQNFATIVVDNIINNAGAFGDDAIIMVVTDAGGFVYYYSPINMVGYSDPLSPGEYFVTLIDLGSQNCKVVKSIVIPEPTTTTTLGEITTTSPLGGEGETTTTSTTSTTTTTLGGITTTSGTGE